MSHGDDEGPDVDDQWLRWAELHRLASQLEATCETLALLAGRLAHAVDATRPGRRPKE